MTREWKNGGDLAKIWMISCSLSSHAGASSHSGGRCLPTIEPSWLALVPGIMTKRRGMNLSNPCCSCPFQPHDDLGALVYEFISNLDVTQPFDVLVPDNSFKKGHQIFDMARNSIYPLNG